MVDLEGPTAKTPPFICRYIGEPGTVPCRIGPLDHLDSGFSGSLLLKPVVAAAAVSLDSRSTLFRRAIADFLAQLPQPAPCPGEFEAENRQPERNDDKCGTRRNDHDDSDRKHRNAYDNNGDAPRRLVGYVADPLH